MQKKTLPADTTLYPVPVVLIGCGQGESANLFTVNRIASVNAEPPMIAVAVRPNRASHALIEAYGEFTVNFPRPEMEDLTDFAGATTGREIDKWEVTGLSRLQPEHVRAPMIAECPVNLECRIVQTLRLPSHTVFIAEVLALYADPEVLNDASEVDFGKVGGGMAYGAAVVRERPVENFKPTDLLERVKSRGKRTG